MQEIKVSFNNQNLQLEGCLALPESPEGRPYPAVLLCHPHPLYGGNMDNTVIVAVSRALVGRGMASLRFNFRGVGNSEGSFAEGVGELDDAYSALAFLSEREEIDKERIGILGYSFGGMIALSAGIECALVKAMAGISPVVPSGLLTDCSKPALFIYGTEDDFVPPSIMLQEIKKMSVPGEVEAIAGADHFWWGYEKEVAEKAAGFFAGHLGL